MSEAALIVAEVILGIALLVVLVAVVSVAATRRLSKGNEATEILRQRYARGEISREQFQRMSHDLEFSPLAGNGHRPSSARDRGADIRPGTDPDW